jgi:hypothetical protein
MKNKTRVCCIDTSEEIRNYLTGQGFFVFDGSFGTRISVGAYNKQNSYSKLLLNHVFPNNIQEYELFVIDMNNYMVIPYQKSDHQLTNITNGRASYFYSNGASTIFNPLPYSAFCFERLVSSHLTRPRIKIVFQAKKEYIEYYYGESPYHSHQSRYSNYDFTNDLSFESLSGTDVKITPNEISKTLFTNFINDISYFQTFQNKETDNYIPLLKSANEDVVSYLYSSDNEIVFMLPQVKDKVSLLKVLFGDVLYKNLSEYFPNINTESWKCKKEYYLPNHQQLLDEKESLTIKYKKDVQVIEHQIVENESKYAFLHNILIESGDKLVKATIEYLKWLGFSNVIDKDTTVKEGLFEEDIQIDLGDDGLLVIEVKGIHRTSTDSECSQIHKIVHRRGKERGKYDVKGLYIVNNERGIEPLKRTLPPFNERQIQDAVNDERGLAYTWQLFNLYYDIENGIISKDEARKRLLLPGLIDFTPNLQSLGAPYNILKEGIVICVELNGQQIAKGGIVAFNNNGRYEKRTIVNIQQNHNNIENCNKGKVGIEVDRAVPKIKEIFLVN